MEVGVRPEDQEFFCDGKLHEWSQQHGSLNKTWTILTGVDIPPEIEKSHKDSSLDKELHSN